VDTRSAAAANVTIEDVRAAAQRLQGVAHRTPVVTSRTLDERAGARVFLKCENFQRMGAFKFRGAYNRLVQLDERQRRGGVVAFSSGNHAQGVALAAQILGIPAAIVMPEDAPKSKVAATRGYGAEVIFYDRYRSHRAEIAQGICDERGAVMVPPFNDPHIIAGAGTAALELLEDAGDLDMLLAPVGGGGLLSGTAISAHAANP
jgi:threonine dehydratase